MWFGIFIVICIAIIVIDEARNKHKSIDDLKKSLKDKLNNVED